MQKVKSIIPENIEVANEFDVNAPNVHFILNSLGHFFIWEKGKKYKWFLLPSAYNYIVKLAMSCFFMLIMGCGVFYVLANNYVFPVVFLLVVGVIILVFCMVKYKKISDFSKYPIISISDSALSLRKNNETYFFQQKEQVLNLKLSDIKYFVSVSSLVVFFRGMPWQLFPGKNASKWEILFSVDVNDTASCLIIAQDARDFYRSLAERANKEIVYVDKNSIKHLL